MASNILLSISKLFKELLENPNNSKINFEIASLYYQQRLFEDSAEYFKRSYQLKYNQDLCAKYLGIIYFHKENYDQALEWCNKSLTVNPKGDDPYYYLALIFQKKSKIPQALDCYQKCIKNNSNHFLAHNGLENFYSQNKQSEKEQPHFNQSIQINQNYDAPYLSNHKNAIKNMRSLHINKRTSNIDEVSDSFTSCDEINERLDQEDQIIKNQLNSQQNDRIRPLPKKLKEIRKPIIRRVESQKPNEIEESGNGWKQQLRQMKQEFASMAGQMISFMREAKQSVGSIKGSKQNQKKVKQQTAHHDDNKLSARDRSQIISTGKLPQECGQQFFKILRQWIFKLTNQVFSSCFNSYLNNQITSHQARIYCCQSMLKNIYAFFIKSHEKISSSHNFMNKVNEYILQAIKYIKYKYPLNEELEVPYKLEHFINTNKRDNTDSIEYDYFYHYGNQFEYRQNGLYNDVIMKMINNINNTTNTNYYLFKDKMTFIFEKVFDPNWKKVDQPEKEKHQFSDHKIDQVKPNHNIQESKTSSKINQSIQIYKQVSQFTQANKNGDSSPQIHSQINLHRISPQKSHSIQPSLYGQKKQRKGQKRMQKQHKDKVQAYTSYVIKRKIPQFVRCYTEEQIKNINILKIRDKSIFRILTKWCEQLWDKFEIQGYFLQKINLIMLKNRKLNYLNWSQKQQLNRYVEQEKAEIKIFVDKMLKESNMKMQYKLMERWMKYDQEIENNTGIFCFNVVENLQYLTIAYLNRLIHGLLKISKKFSEQYMHEDHLQLQLLTFTIKDLLRCRFRSKEEQSYKMLQYLLSQQSQLCVLRVKNRLNGSNNDIMLNLLFEKMICQIQLDVQTHSTRFSECSTNFNHFIYEIERSYFLPITEFCNIWHCHDKRMEFYKKLQDQRIRHYQTNKNCVHKFKRRQDGHPPFICTNCNKIYYHFNYLLMHTMCVQCKQIKCANCVLKSKSDDQLRKIFNINFVTRYEDASKKFPMLTYCLLKECQYTQNGTYFICYHKNYKNYLISLKYNNNKYVFDCSMRNKAIKDFLSKYVVLQLPHNYQPIIFQSQIEHELFKLYLKDVVVEQKDQLVLGNFSINKKEYNHIIDQQFLSKITQEHSYGQKRIKKLIVDCKQGNQLPVESINHIIANFDNLEYIWIVNNKLKYFPKFRDDNKIKMISLIKTDIEAIQENFCLKKLKQIEYLVVNSSRLHQIPEVFKSITTLIHLQITNSELKILPSQIFQQLGKCLKHLNLSFNKLQKLPESAKLLIKLEHLNLSQNNIIFFPQAIVEIKNLTYLNLSENQIKQIPSQFKELQNLESLLLTNCKLTVIHMSFSKFTKLRQLNLTSNFLINAQSLKDSKISKQLILSNTFHSNFKLKNHDISQIYSSECEKIILKSIAIIHNQALRCINVKQLTISRCNLTCFPDFKESPNLLYLDLSCNRIFCFDQNDISGLKKLKTLILNKNHLKQFPSSYQLIDLQELFLDSCDLEQVPEFNGLQQLKTLIISRNRFNNIPNQLFETLKNLIVLDIRENNFYRKVKQIQNQLIFGDRIINLSALEQLYLDHCCLTEIPKGIEKCKKLKVLRLQHNKLKYIPKLQLPNLQILKINDNEIKRFQDLQILNISHKILPSIIILRLVLNGYKGQQSDKEQISQLGLLAAHINEELWYEVQMQKDLMVHKYKHIDKQYVNRINLLLSIEAKYVVFSRYILQVNEMMQNDNFYLRYLQMIRSTLVERLKQVENEDQALDIRQNKKIDQYNPCYKQILITNKTIKEKKELLSQRIDNRLRLFQNLVSQNTQLQLITMKYRLQMPKVSESFAELLEIGESKSLKFDIYFKYYIFNQKIVLPINIKMLQHSSKIHMFDFNNKYQSIYKFIFQQVKEKYLDLNEGQ